MKSFKPLLAGLSFIGASFLPFSVYADALKIGVMDMATIMTSAPQAKEASEKLKKEFKSREEKIIEAEKTLKEKAEKLQRNGAIMSEAEKMKLETELRSDQRKLQQLQAEYREDATLRYQEETKKLMAKVQHAVDDIAKKEKYDLIIQKEVVPFANKAVDVTDKVLKAIGSA